MEKTQREVEVGVWDNGTREEEKPWKSQRENILYVVSLSQTLYQLGGYKTHYREKR